MTPQTAFLGIDTSNYTTSAALFAGETLLQRKRLLPVKEGQIGLRQSDAVFHHVQQLPDLLASIWEEHPRIESVGVSVRPRDQEGSYMPCFTVGHGTARAISGALGVPLYSFSHQAGHIMAALYSSGKIEWCRSRFLAFHVSGGTTEALLVTPHREFVFQCELVAASLGSNASAADNGLAHVAYAFGGRPRLQLAHHRLSDGRANHPHNLLADDGRFRRRFRHLSHAFFGSHFCRNV